MADPKLKPIAPRLFFVDESGRAGTVVSLRDLFAAFALAGALADSEISGTPEERVGWAFEQADLMLAARENP